MIDARALLVAMLVAAEADPSLAQRLRRLLVDDDVLVRGADLGVPTKTWRRACRSGQIRGARRVGREYRAPRAAAREWLASCPLPPPAPSSGTREVEQSPGDELDRVLVGARRRRA